MKLFSIIIRMFFIVVVCCVQLLHGMENVLQNDALGINKEKAIWKILLTRGIQWFDCKMIGSLAVNKNFDAILCETAQERMQYLQNHDYQLDNVKYIEWHKYGIVGGKIAIGVTSRPVKNLWIERQCLLHPMKLSHYYLRHNFYGLLPHQPRPFFNDRGDFCFYGYGEILDLGNEQSGAVVEYSLCANGKGNILRCVTNIKKDEKYFFNLKFFLEFPVLLQAFLHSSKVYKDELALQHNNIPKVFAIEGVTIPENYKEYKQYFFRTDYTSFDDLPESLRKAIVDLYKMQNKKKKKKKIVGCL